MRVPDEIHTILFTVEGPLGSVINHIITTQEVNKQKVQAFYVSMATDDQVCLPCLFERIYLDITYEDPASFLYSYSSTKHIIHHIKVIIRGASFQLTALMLGL